MRIDIESIIEKCGLNSKEVAVHLFPDNKYPKLALNRVISGESFLDSEQLSKLAMMADLSVSQLYKSGWKTSSKKNKIILTNEDFTIELDTVSWISKIFHKKSLFHESVVCSEFIPISTYLKEIRTLINKYNKNVKNNRN